MSSLVIINGVVYDIVSTTEPIVCEKCVCCRKDIECPRLANAPVLVCSWLDNIDDGSHYFVEREV